MPLAAPTFVVHRRLNRPLADVQRGLADRTLVAPTRIIRLEPHGFMHVDAAFRPVAPFSSHQPLPTWCVRAHLLAARGRTVAAVELEVSMWSRDATSVTLRPVSRHPERWRRWRLRSYFALAHGAVDATVRLLAERAEHAVEAVDVESAAHAFTTGSRR
jgi:hypothetical protein